MILCKSPYYFITILRLCACVYRSVTLKCGVGRLVGGSMNGGRCAHGALSSDGELSPRTSGTRSELSDGEFPCLLGDCELVAGAALWVVSPRTRRPRCSGKEVRHEWVGSGTKGRHSQPGGILGTKKGVSFGNFNCIRDWQRLWSLTLSVRSGRHLGDEGRPLRVEEGAGSG